MKKTKIIKIIFSVIFGILSVAVVISTILYVKTHVYTYKLISTITTCIGAAILIIDYSLLQKQNKELHNENKSLKEKLEK